MEAMKNRIDAAVKELRRERDELRVKVRLAKMEADEEWTEIEEIRYGFEKLAKKL